ncbi:hypothetical protein [Thermogladius sp.]|uniref:hypothetical protein n=1 Tax=Thermogladius sp. TaxID=2023064 RepID=UPI003D0C6718
MVLIKVRCPRCGYEFYVNVSRGNPKGSGAYYGKRIERLTPTHKAILEVLREHGPSTKKRIGAILAEKGIRLSGNSLSGRLSELLGAGYVSVEKTRVREVDPKSKQYRFVLKPVWDLTEKGVMASLGIEEEKK